MHSPKQIPAKCARCALLSMAEVRSLHGATGDHCYVSEVCRSRRSYARHYRSRNAARRQKHSERVTGLEVTCSSDEPSAELIVYRPSGYATPIERIAAVVRQGKTKLAVVPPIYCAGVVPQQIYACIEAILAVLQRDYGIAHFANVVQQATGVVPKAAPQLGFASQPRKNRPPRHREISITLPDVVDHYSALLLLYRQMETGAVVAIKVEVWRGATPEAEIPLLDCRGLLPSQLHAYLTQVLVLLNSRYKIRWFARQVPLPLEACLPLLVQTEQTSKAESEPEAILDLDPLWRELETSLQQYDLFPVQALEVAAEGISQIVLQFAQFAESAFEELEAVAERGVMLPEDAFNRHVRQTMEIDFEPFMQPLVNLPGKSPEQQEVLEGDSVVRELDRTAVLQVLDQQMRQEPELTEAEIFNRTLTLAHDEDVAAWAAAIARWMRQHRSSLPLMELVQAVQMPLLNVWLGALLGDGFVIEQRGQFYDLSSVWISVS